MIFTKVILYHRTYLFILVAEGLSALFTKTVDQGVIKGLQVITTAPKVYYLFFFADDSLLFGETSKVKCPIFKDLRNVYEQASSLRIFLSSNLEILKSGYDFCAQSIGEVYKNYDLRVRILIRTYDFGQKIVVL